MKHQKIIPLKTIPAINISTIIVKFATFGLIDINRFQEHANISNKDFEKLLDAPVLFHSSREIGEQGNS